MTDFAERLRELRISKDLYQRELAEKLNVSRVTITHYETGERFPDPNMLKKIADFFGVTTDYLLGRSGNTKKPLSIAAHYEGPPNRKIVLDQDMLREEFEKYLKWREERDKRD